jgi:tryptophanyl-tRNA synthetase
MAADILAYDADIVPVGEDQLQHIEVCRDIATRFNHMYGETFVMPKGKILEQAARVPGVDGEKMSKSYNNTLALFEDPKKLRKQIMRIVTDSRAMEESKEPVGDVLYDLYLHVATPDELSEMAALYRRGGFGYGQVKTALADAADRYFAPARERRKELEGDMDRVKQILGDGAARARKKAGDVLRRAEKACGIKA